MAAAHDILVIGEGISLAHVTRPLLVARALASRGRRIVFATGERYRGWVERQGLARVHPIYTPDADAVYGRLRRMQPMYTAAELERSVRADLALIEAVGPALVIGDCRNSLRISAELSGVPYAAIMNANCTPWFGGVVRAPASFPLNRVLGKDRVDRYLSPLLGRPARALACRHLSGPFAKVQKRMGTRGRCRDFRLMFTSDDLNLIADLPQFMPAHRLPDHCHYIGPLCWMEDPEHDAATRELLATIDRHSPLVYLSMGSTGSGSVIERIKPVLSQMPCQFVVTTGQPAQVGDWPGNMHPLPFASAAPVLERAAAVICHGGNGTIYQALAWRVPIIAVPTFFDQEIQADQVVAQGLGVRVDEKDVAESLVPALRQVLDDPGYIWRATGFGQLLDRSDAAAGAADLVEAFLAEQGVTRQVA